MPVSINNPNGRVFSVATVGCTSVEAETNASSKPLTQKYSESFR
jgi:hypothetical protein